MQEEIVTEQSLNTASLFQTSLRRWQAEWRANRGGTAAPSAVGRRLIGASAARRQQRPAGQAVVESARA